MVPRGGPRCRQLRAAWRAVSSCWAPCPGMNHVTGPGRDAEQLFSSLKGECSELGHANSPPHFTGSNFPLSGDLWLKLVSVQEPRPPQRPSGSAGAPTGAAAEGLPSCSHPSRHSGLVSVTGNAGRHPPPQTHWAGARVRRRYQEREGFKAPFVFPLISRHHSRFLIWVVRMNRGTSSF